jgi:hypothetical protein
MYCDGCKQGMRTEVKRSKLINHAAVLVSRCLSCRSWETVAVIRNFFKGL